MKLAVIALLALVLLGGGGAGAYFLLIKPAEASLGPADEAAKAAHDAKLAEAEAAAAEAATKFVQIDALILPIIGERGITQNVSLVISIEVPDDAAAEEVKRLSPRLRDAYIQDMYGALSRKSVLKDGVLQVAPIKARLERATTKVLGDGKVKGVLLQVVQQRRV